ncbi:TldD/PmbA family protein [soil metagenome]
MISLPIADAVLTNARGGGADFAELYVERWRRRALRTIDGKVEEATSAISQGGGLRLFFGTDVVYGYTNDLTEASLRELAETLLRHRGDERARVDATGRGGLDLRRTRALGIHAPDVPFDTRSKAWRVERLRELDAGARVAPEVRQVEGHLLEWEQDVVVANSDGTWIDDRRVRTRLAATAIASDGAETQTGFYGAGLSMGLELLDWRSPDEVGRTAGERAMTNLRAKPAPAGTMPVVIGNGFGGVIFHEALGHLVETTFVAPKASVLSDKLGQRIASSVVTYVDDGTTPHGWGSSEFDDEGAPTERTVLIQEGVLKSYMVDRRGALQTGYRPTGSGRRQDYTFAPTSRMRNTFITPGTTPRDDLFDGIELGLYAKALGGGQVRPGSGEYNFSVVEGYVIRHGRIEESVRGAMLVGKGPDTIMHVDAVSDDLANEPGMCGSKSGSIPTEVGQPHLRVSRIVVGGEA